MTRRPVADMLCSPAPMIVPILLNILGPILLMVGLGALLRYKFGLDLATLSKLNIYLFTPAFIFQHVATSRLAWADMGGIVAITVTNEFPGGYWENQGYNWFGGS